MVALHGLGVSHVMRCINVRYLLIYFYLLTYLHYRDSLEDKIYYTGCFKNPIKNYDNFSKATHSYHKKVGRYHHITCYKQLCSVLF